jgi:thioredoxin 2
MLTYVGQALDKWLSQPFEQLWQAAAGAGTMNDSLHVVCPNCGAVNRMPPERLKNKPNCGRCHSTLFNGKPVALDQRSFKAHLERNDIPLVVDFWAPWCGPCHAMASAFEAAAKHLEPHVRLAKIDTEQEATLAAQFNIRSIPTLAVFRGGREIVRQTGAMSAKQLLDWIRNTTA